MKCIRPAGWLFAASLISSGALIFAGNLPLQAQNKTKSGSKTTPSASAAKPDAAAIALGKKSYAKNTCATCHAIAGNGGNSGPDLTSTGSVPGHTATWLADQVANPKKHNPDSTMPAFAQAIKGKDLVGMGLYLASLKATSAAAGTAVKPRSGEETAAIAKVEKLGGYAGPIAQNDSHLEINLHLAGASVTDASLTGLAATKNVSRLDLSQTGITDAGLAAIKSWKDLTELHLEGTKITDAGLVHLAGMRSLTYLNLYGDNITDAGLEKLAGLTKLRHLYIWQTKVTEEGAAKLKKSLPMLDIVRGWDTTPAQPPKK